VKISRSRSVQGFLVLQTCEKKMKKNASKLLSRFVLISLVALLGSVRGVQSADLIIATNAEITFPSCLDEITYNYFFTVVDDGGGISTPTISNLDYEFTGPSQVDVYDSDPFTYATFEVAVKVPSPALGVAANDCFAITYEGESVNPCFDVVKPPIENCVNQEFVSACAKRNNGMVRIVPPDVACRKDENPIDLVVATPDEGNLNGLAVPDAPASRREQ
jgi:hypothetical protein